MTQVKKAALLIGINYKGTSSELNGCINDVINTKSMLLDAYGYDEKDISLLTDETSIKPTSQNIITQLYTLAVRSFKDDLSEIWITYSGHGSYIKDNNGDEDDGYDECLVPIDYESSGIVKDDILNNVLSYMNPKTRVVFIVDACHSETILDLPYRYISGKKNVVENKNSTACGNIIMISGCKDTQTSSDAYGINNSKDYSGAMTSSLLYSLKKFEYNISCWQLLKEMRVFLEDRKFTQIPQMCCTEPLDNITLFSCSKKQKYFINRT